MYKALYRECRPEIFEEVLGQEHIVKILRNQLKNNEVSHAYLFCGTRGTGKTTMARLLAKGVNCQNPKEEGGPCGECEHCRAIQKGTYIDVIEIDAASNNGVDNIRELRESIKYPPAVANKKIYIIDEVHMLSSGAFNALLKTLEEPPEYVMFILATTEPQKLLATILSRCMRLDFKRVREDVLCEGMAKICEGKGIKIEESALKLIATNADGSVRDGLSILDQCLAGGENEITRADVLEFLGTMGEETFIEITDLVKHGRVSDALLLIDRILADGKDVRQFIKDWMGHYRNLMISKFLKAPEDVLGMSMENVKRIREQGERIDLADINNAIIELSHTMAEAKWSTQPRILLELCAVKLATGGAFAAQQAAAPSMTSQKNVNKQVAAPTSRTSEDTKAVTKEGNSISSYGEAVDEAKAHENDAETEGALNSYSVPEENAEEVEALQNKAAPIATEGSGSYDYEELWTRIFEEAETDKASFNLLRGRSSLEGIDEHFFYVAVDNKFTGRYIKENKETLEELMSGFLGRKVAVKGVLKTEESGSSLNPNELKQAIENLLGMEIEMK